MTFAPMQLLLLFLFLFLCCAPSAALAQHENSIIPLSSELRPDTNSSVWRSPSGFFAFGFYNTLNGYALCIFLDSVSEKTIVWTPNNLDPILPNDIFSLIINPTRVQLIQNKQGIPQLYYDLIITQEVIAWGSMLDNGNFVLYNSKEIVIWQSFDSPADTLLPGQRLSTGQELVSRASGTDLSRGMFRLKMQNDGNLVQYPVSTPDTAKNAYYASGTYDRGNNLSLNLDRDGRLYIYDGISSIYNITSGVGLGGESFHLVRVDPDGIFRLYSLPLDGGGEWTVRWSSTEDRCAPKGICGVNSFCTYDDDVVNCTCLPGFGDECKEVFDVCGNKNTSLRYEMRRMENVTWEDNFYGDVNKTQTEQECGDVCLSDCGCVVAFFDEGKCRKQRLPLRYGIRSSSVSNTALVRVSVPVSLKPAEPPNASGFGKGKDLHKYLIVGVLIGVPALLLSSTIIYFFTKTSEFFGESKQNANKLVLNNHGSLALKRYSYKEIKKITKSFSEKLGQGGYGIVYKGELPDGHVVAVKVLKNTHDNADEFFNEVASISRTSHVNIVNLLGFCSEREKRALVYEFMPNKSLDKYIYKRDSVHTECCLEWKKLYEIAVGVARGLEYLHRGCNMRIVHFDIKPQNILLDEDFCPKISDFGLAKLCMKKQSIISMLGTRGTIGYIAPEVFSRNFGVVSHKSDVYSYGIMLLQMVEARTNIEMKSFQPNEGYFLENIYEHVLVQNEKVYAEIREEEAEVVRKMLMVGFWCIQTAPSDRASMNNVVEMFAGNMQSIQIPPLPFLLSSPKPEFSCLLPEIVETPCSSAD